MKLLTPALCAKLALTIEAYKYNGYKYRTSRETFEENNQILANDIAEDLGRNYQNFQSLLTSFIAGLKQPGSKNKDLTVYDFWGYGCYCLPASGMPLSGGFGEPVDNLDRICFNRKRCIGCLEINHPDGKCDPETVRYRYETKTSGDNESTVEGKCLNKKGSCARSVCECDMKLAHEIREHLINEPKGYQMKHNLFVGKFDRDLQCQKRHNGGSAPDMCCDDGTGYMLSYSSLTHDCCPNGSGGNAIRMLGNC